MICVAWRMSSRSGSLLQIKRDSSHSTMEVIDLDQVKTFDCIGPIVQYTCQIKLQVIVPISVANSTSITRTV
jgi:hypothetical protein